MKKIRFEFFPSWSEFSKSDLNFKNFFEKISLLRLGKKFKSDSRHFQFLTVFNQQGGLDFKIEFGFEFFSPE